MLKLPKVLMNIQILIMQNNQNFSTQTCYLEDDTLSRIIEKYQDHPSKKHIKPINSQSQLKEWKGERSIECLVPNRATQENDIYTSILKQNSDVFSFYFAKDINAYISPLKVPNHFKKADITSASKKTSKLSKNYLVIIVQELFSNYRSE